MQLLYPAVDKVWMVTIRDGP